MDTDPKSSQHGRRLSILIAEDNADEASTLRVILERAGHRVEVARNGTEALVVARLLMPDVLLLDLGLPGLDGFQVASQIRSHPGLDAIRIIAVSGFSSEQHYEQSAQSGISHYLVKPVDPVQLLALL